MIDARSATFPLPFILLVAAACGGDEPAAPEIPGPPASLTISPPLAELHALGDSVQYTATVRDANGDVVSDAAVAWSSADEAVVTVNSAGWAVAQANGTAAVRADAGDVFDEAAVQVEQVVASVEVSAPTDSLAQGDTTRLVATVADANGAAIHDATVVWDSSDPAAAVDPAGLVTAVGWGAGSDLTITATTDGVSGTAAVHIYGQIAFATGRDGGFEIYLMNADGSGATRLTPDDGDDETDPAWSPDGSRIALHSNRDNQEIWAMDADGLHATRLTFSVSLDSAPAWSPNGSRIAYESSGVIAGSGIFVMDADGFNRTHISDDGADDNKPAWSPDGSQIAFESPRDGNSEIYVMDADGSNPTRLTTDAGFDGDPAWSPDGRRLAFETTRDGNGEIYVMEVDRSNLMNLTNHMAADTDPAWSPDGSRIAFVSDRDGNEEIYIMDADGSNPIRLTTFLVPDVRPAWRPRP